MLTMKCSPYSIKKTTTEPYCEPGLVFYSINMENSPLIPGALLVGPAQHKPKEMEL